MCRLVKMFTHPLILTLLMPVERILIWGKTYPELSKKYGEVVCTAGCREDGSPVRLYPVPQRYLPDFAKYKLFDWIEVNLERNQRDIRPESYKVVGMPRVVGHLDPGRNNWKERRDFIFKNPAWRYGCLEELKAAQKVGKHSLGVVKVGRVERVWLERRPEKELLEHRQKMQALKSRLTLFDEPQMRDLEPQAVKAHLRWYCQQPEGVNTCPGHSAGIMDWGLAEMGRRNGPDTLLQRVQDLANLEKHDLHLLMGNFAAHQAAFGIIGVWFPQTEAYITAKEAASKATRRAAKRGPAPSPQLGLGL